MPKAVKGTVESHDRTKTLPMTNHILPGVLIECDPSIKAIIVKIDSEQHNSIIVVDIDDSTLVIKDSMLKHLKIWLEEALEDTQQKADDSGSD